MKTRREPRWTTHDQTMWRATRKLTDAKSVQEHARLDRKLNALFG